MTVKRLLLAVLLLWLLFLMVGYFLPQHYHISRTIRIDASPAAIHPWTQDLSQWDHWQTWTDIDPTVQITPGAITLGQGAYQSWLSESGKGELLVTAADVEQGVRYQISFNNGNNRAEAEIRYHLIDSNHTELTWQMDGQLNTPIFGGYLALFMDHLVGPSFDTGLQRLKALAEQPSN